MKKVFDNKHERFYSIEERIFANGIEIIKLKCLDRKYHLSEQQMTSDFYKVLVHRKQFTYETR